MCLTHRSYFSNPHFSKEFSKLILYTFIVPPVLGQGQGIVTPSVNERPNSTREY